MKQNLSPQSPINYFTELKDPRIERRKLHLLEDIIVLTIAAVICGADGWTEVEEYGKTKEQWLRSILKLPNGIPSHDTLGDFFARIKTEDFERCFIQWISAVSNITEGEIIAIDGKTLRSSYDKRNKKAAIHMVSAWASQNNIVLGQLKTAEKSNEITAIPQLLEVLCIKGCIVTIDAMGCQTKIAEKIIEKEGDYMLALKGNQGELHEHVITSFERINPKDTHEKTEKDHGRIETRRCTIIDDLRWIEQWQAWKNLHTLIKIESTRTLDNKTTTENRYYISSLNTDAKNISEAIRKHWGIENSLHWILDVAYREDDCRMRNGCSAENFSTVRRISLNLLKNEKNLNKGIATKRLKAGWDNDYLKTVLKI